MIKPQISFSDFSALDIRVGEIIDVIYIKDSQKILELFVDMGSDYGKVTILAGIKQWYTKKDLLGKKLLFCANLEPKTLLGKTSQGMMLAVDSSKKPILIKAPRNAQIGDSIR